MCVSSFDSFDPINVLYCTFLYLLMCASFDSFDLIECTVLYILYALMFTSFDSFDPIQYTALYIFRPCKKEMYILTIYCYFLTSLTLSTWMHVNGYNFLNNGLIFNCFIPLELSQSPLFSSACFSSILLIRSKESKETAWLYSTVYAFRSKESKDTKILPEMNRGDWDDSNGIKQLKIRPLWR